MKKHYLDFEKPLKDFDDEIQNLVSIDSESEKLDRLKNMRIETVSYTHLTLPTNREV